MNKFLLVVVLFLLGCSKEPKPYESYQPILARFREIVAPLHTAGSSYRVLDLATMADFAWDSVYYFTRYQDAHSISRTIGVAWQGPAVPDDANRLFFVQAGQVVTFVDFPSYGYSDEPEPVPLKLYTCARAPRVVYSRQTARFAIARSCSSAGLFCPLVPVTCLDTKWVHELVTHGCSPDTIKSLTDSLAARLTRIH